MPVFDTRDPDTLRQQLALNKGLIVACYCAAWCDTCRDYQSEFSALSEKWPQHTFVWVDIEDDPELLDEHDVEDFPTILIQGSKGNLFFGEQLPYISHLDRLIRSAEQGNAPVVSQGPRAMTLLLDQA